MPARTAEAEWRGNLTEGKGNIKLGSGAFEGSYDWRSRSADGPGTPRPGGTARFAAHLGAEAPRWGYGTSTTTLPTAPCSTASCASAIRSSGKRCSGSVVSAPAATAAETSATACCSAAAGIV